MLFDFWFDRIGLVIFLCLDLVPSSRVGVKSGGGPVEVRG